ncbi:UdgX family uracil-DNA binding protein [Phenylobacterium sp.]|uniref:UdgX family uracil-DNA binding protein n=1 Tax=Phenylobacterium sp. TaxID=1871053 RepID=UPI00301D505C
MRVARLAHETDFGGWREAARRLRAEGVAPDGVLWIVDGGGSLFAADAEPEAATAAGCVESRESVGFTVSRDFLGVAERAVLHRSEERFGLLYRLLWRLRREPRLMRDASDPDVWRAQALARDVNRAAHKMKAFVRFRSARDAAGEAFVAWFEPAHRVVEATAPFFARRFANMRFSILTPDVCVHWDLRSLSFTPGADPADAPRADALEDYWRTYYASIFNPARLKVDAMTKEMPKRYWRNLPEAALIPDLIANAQDQTRQMVAAPASKPARRIAGVPRAGAAAPSDDPPRSLEAVAAGVSGCRRCELWRDATQGVAGEGAGAARIMFVGEQPGDQEDLAGRPFVGPAGQLFDRALAQAGVPRDAAWITNAVKHFRHELQGKRRIHKTPSAGQVSACRWWLDAERALMRPKVIVALGATAALGVMGKAIPVGRLRGAPIVLADGAQGVVTWHPSYMLRLRDAAAKAAAFEGFVADLKMAWSLAA